MDEGRGRRAGCRRCACQCMLPNARMGPPPPPPAIPATVSSQAGMGGISAAAAAEMQRMGMGYGGGGMMGGLAGMGIAGGMMGGLAPGLGVGVGTRAGDMQLMQEALQFCSSTLMHSSGGQMPMVGGGSGCERVWRAAGREVRRPALALSAGARLPGRQGAVRIFAPCTCVCCALTLLPMPLPPPADQDVRGGRRGRRQRGRRGGGRRRQQRRRRRGCGPPALCAHPRRNDAAPQKLRE